MSVTLYNIEVWIDEEWRIIDDSEDQDEAIELAEAMADESANTVRVVNALNNLVVWEA